MSASSTLGALSINERAAEEFMKKALEADRLGQHERAVEFYERTLAENPDHEQACFNLALLYDRQADDAKAIELYERLCTAEPVHINALINLAVLYEDNAHYEEAARCLQAVLKSNPNHERARLYLKDVLAGQTAMLDDDLDRKVDRNSKLLDVPITDFELSVRSRNCLKKMGINTLGDLLRTREQELMAFKNFGETSLTEIRALLASRGLSLGQYAEQEAAPATAAAELASDVPQEVLLKSVADLELSVRSRKALQRLGINTLSDLAMRTEDELLGCKNFGVTSLNELKQLLAAHGLSLRKLEA